MNYQRPTPRVRTVGVTNHTTIKQAALLFDKVFLVQTAQEAKSDLSGAGHDVHARHCLLNTATLHLKPELTYLYRTKKTPLHQAVAQIAKALYSKKYSCVEVLQTDFDHLPSEPGSLAYIAALNSLSQIDESKATWEQIKEFREDRRTVEKYRDLRMWLLDSIKAHSLSEAEDIVARKVSDYENALKKHGFTVRKGVYGLVYDRNFLLGVASAFTLKGFAGLLEEGCRIVGSVFMQFAQTQFVLPDEIRKNKCEGAAILFEIRNRFSSEADLKQVKKKQLIC